MMVKISKVLIKLWLLIFWQFSKNRLYDDKFFHENCLFFDVFEITKIGDSFILIFPKTGNWKFYNYEKKNKAKPPTI
jgi:hypothetical protein